MIELFKEKIYCFYGLFTGSKIITADGAYPAITYKIIWEQAKGKKGFHNIMWKEEIQHWVLFQCILDE